MAFRPQPRRRRPAATALHPDDARRTSAEPIDLAEAPRFTLGSLEVRPATLELVQGEWRESLQPRIMQVLVALARRREEVVSHDELMAAGWGGDVVGDDALHRCIARIRKLASDSGAFRLETIPRVGYRLSEDRPRAGPPLRWIALAGVAAAAILLVALAWLRPWAAAPATPIVSVAEFAAGGDDPALKGLGQSVAHQVRATIGNQTPPLATTNDPKRATLYVDGMVSRSGDVFHATVHVIDVRARATLWSGEVTAPAATLPQQVGARAADKLNCGVAGYRRELGLDIASRTLWFEACDFIAGHTGRQDAPRAAAEQLVARAPRFPEAQAMLAIIKLRWSQTLPPDEAAVASKDARAHAWRAIELGPRIPMANLAAAITTPWSAWAEQEAWLRKGLGFTPDDPFLNNRLGLMLSNVGRFEEASRHSNRSVQLAPLAVRLVSTDIAIQRMANHLAESGSELARAESLWPENPAIQRARLLAALNDDPATALRILHDPQRRPRALRDDEVEAFRRYASARTGGGGRTEAVAGLVAVLDRPRRGSPEGANPYILALLQLGAIQPAIEGVEADAGRTSVPVRVGNWTAPRRSRGPDSRRGPPPGDDVGEGPRRPRRSR